MREIQGHLAEIYGTEVSPELISTITDAVLEDAKAWQSRPLESVYAIVYLDAMAVKLRDGQAVRNFVRFLAIGVNLDGERDVLGIWFVDRDGAGRRPCARPSDPPPHRRLRTPRPHRPQRRARRSARAVRLG